MNEVLLCRQQRSHAVQLSRIPEHLQLAALSLQPLRVGPLALLARCERLACALPLHLRNLSLSISFNSHSLRTVLNSAQPVRAHAFQVLQSCAERFDQTSLAVRVPVSLLLCRAMQTSPRPQLALPPARGAKPPHLQLLVLIRRKYSDACSDESLTDLIAFSTIPAGTPKRRAISRPEDAPATPTISR